jgi:hypothetical protein
MTSWVSLGNDARLVLARQPVQTVEGCRVFSSVDLEPLLEPEHGGVFVHVGPEPLLDGSHTSALRLDVFHLTLNLTHCTGVGRPCAAVYSSH